ncbi:MAG TPA: PqqD family protein [Vicinamibacterales bacterium]|nr:PqqD family protein [Vicinamibacterales bacterium]
MTLRLSPDVVFRNLDGEAVLLDLGSGTYFGLNEVGTRIWQMIESGHDTPAIVDAIAAEYAADPATIAVDVARLLDELQSRRLLVTDRADDRP